MVAVRALVLSLVLVGCSSKPEQKAPPKDAAPAEPACEMNLDNLAGRTFVHVTKNSDTKAWDEDIMARARFYTDSGVTKVRYNTRALADMYTYTCAKSADGTKLDCKEDDPRIPDYCRALIANAKEEVPQDQAADKFCTVDEIVKLTGVSPEDAAKGAKTIKDELKKLPKKEFADMKKVYNSPNNQLRGVLHVKVKAKDCNLVVEDQYETIAFGVVREMQNVVGSAYFRETKNDYVFEHCKDDKNLIALAKPGTFGKPGETKREWAPGETVPFRFVGPEIQKPESGCTYTMDSWMNYEPVTKDAAVGTDSSGRLDWSFTYLFQKANPRNIAHLYRYKTCGSEPKKLVSVSCTGVKVQ